MQKKSQVPVQFMVSPRERQRIHAQSKRRGFKNYRAYLLDLVKQDMATDNA